MKRLLIIAVALVGVMSGSAQQPSAAGVWYGTIGPASDDFNIVVKLENVNVMWMGSVEIVNQNGAPIPLSKITVAGRDVSFSIGGPDGDITFKGAISEDGAAIEGDFTQGNVRLPFKLGKNAQVSAPAFDGRHAAEMETQIASFAGTISDRPFVAPLNHPAIGYGGATEDAVDDFNRRVSEGKVKLNSESEKAFFRSVLDALNIPVESQIAVFMQTSLQGKRIGPANPRTIFFNDSVAVGWVRGGFIEIAAQDAKQGVNFYMLPPLATEALGAGGQCLGCHLSRNSLDVPGMLVRSIHPDRDGLPLYQFGTQLTDHRSPLAQRWGGWYVTGTHGAMHHMGNAVVNRGAEPESMVTPQTLNVRSLTGKFDTGLFVTPHSDIVALMVFDHQMHMMNLLTRIGWEFRVASFLENASKKRNDSISRQLRDNAKDFVDYMLFVDEAPLTSKVEGTSGFAEVFSARGPADSKGRSLRQLDLEHRLMRFPCSYMIYSPAFDGLPSEMKALIYERTWQVLSGAEKDKKYDRLSSADRRAIIEILRETKMDLPGYFRID